jgi:hypothetical protein
VSLLHEAAQHTFNGLRKRFDIGSRHGLSSARDRPPTPHPEHSRAWRGPGSNSRCRKLLLTIRRELTSPPSKPAFAEKERSRGRMRLIGSEPSSSMHDRAVRQGISRR